MVLNKEKLNEKPMIKKYGHNSKMLQSLQMTQTMVMKIKPTDSAKEKPPRSPKFVETDSGNSDVYEAILRGMGIPRKKIPRASSGRTYTMATKNKNLSGKPNP